VFNSGSGKTTLETEELLEWKRVDKLINGVCLLDDRIRADEEGCEEGVS